MNRLTLILGLLCLFVGAKAQYVVSNLRVVGKDVIEIFESNVQIDTLIMDDKSRIVFLSPETNLVIKNAFIGEKCTWDASGQSEEAPALRDVGVAIRGFSADGLSGRHLNATVTFRYLGNLTIDASGATGKLGSSSSTTREGYVGMQGGNGGDGGMVSLTYGSVLPIAFNEGGVRSIYVNLRAGRGNRGGQLTNSFELPQVPSQLVTRYTSQDASFDLWGNQKAAANGEAIPRLSRAQNGGTADIPQPMYTVVGSQGVQYGNVQLYNRQARRRTTTRWGQMGVPGKNGSLLLQKLD